MGRRARRTATASALLAIALTSGCSSKSEVFSGASTVKRTRPTTLAAAVVEEPRYQNLAAVVQVPSIEIRRDPADRAAFLSLPKVNENGAPQTFLVREQRPGWDLVLLPVRPNGSSGWVRAADVRLVGLPYRLVVDTEHFLLDVYEGDTLLRSINIGAGTDQTPTPGGLYYIKELLQPPDQDTVYGHYVFGLSGFSNVLVDWPGGGVLGIHGTNDPTSSLGRKVSHGCIRMRNDDIEYLAALLPLGTPVEIEA